MMFVSLECYLVDFPRREGIERKISSPAARVRVWYHAQLKSMHVARLVSRGGVTTEHLGLATCPKDPSTHTIILDTPVALRCHGFNHRYGKYRVTITPSAVILPSISSVNHGMVWYQNR